MSRQFATWTRWIGWTALFAVALSVWGAAVFPVSSLRVPDAVVLVVFLGGILGLAALAFAIGVRVADWSWVLGVVVASWLQGFLVPLYLLYLLFTLPAAWGVRLGQQRKADLSANPTSGDHWTPAPRWRWSASAASSSRGGFSGVREEVGRVADSEEIRPVVDSDESKVPFGSFVVLTLEAVLLVVLFLDYGLMRAHSVPPFCNRPECVTMRVFLDISAISSFAALGGAALAAFNIWPRVLPMAAVGASIVSIGVGAKTGVELWSTPNAIVMVVLISLLLVKWLDR